MEEVPIGCVIVHEGKIIARGYNRRNTDKNTLSHAELNAIRKASKKLGDWRLEGCTMYVTLEPCQMCSGALVQSRIDEVVIGCMNPKAGCAGSVMNLLQIEGFNHQVNAFHIFQGTAGEKEAGKNPEEAGSRAPCRADTVRESGTERKVPGDLLLTESCENIKIKS